MRRVSFLGTGGVLDEPAEVASIRDREFPPSAFAGPTTIVLDLGVTRLTSRALHELVVTMGQRLRGGIYGEMRLVIATADDADAEIIDLLAQQYDFPLFIARSSRGEDVEEARPAGALTGTELETLDMLRSIGSVTGAGLAGAAGLNVTAASNRLANLERKGYVYRFKRNRRSGDVYVDPRSDSNELLQNWASIDVAPRRAALLAAGIHSDPYDRTPLVFEGEAAERAAEILRRRGRIK
jgi:DNA-binding MarR family transcriptional regulator